MIIYLSKFPKQCLESVNVPMWVPLSEGVRTRAILDTDFVEYVPNKASVSFSPEETNTKNMQIAETEYEMGGWHPIVIRKGKCSIRIAISLPENIMAQINLFNFKIVPQLVHRLGDNFLTVFLF